MAPFKKKEEGKVPTEDGKVQRDDEAKRQQEEEEEEESLFVSPDSPVAHETEEAAKDTIQNGQKREHDEDETLTPAAKKSKTNVAATETDDKKKNVVEKMTEDQAKAMINKYSLVIRDVLLKDKESEKGSVKALQKYDGHWAIKDGNVRWYCDHRNSANVKCTTDVGPKFKDVHSHNHKIKSHGGEGAYKKNQDSGELPVGECLLHGIMNCDSNKGAGWDNFNSYQKHVESHFPGEKGRNRPTELQTKTELHRQAAKAKETGKPYSETWATWVPAEGSKRTGDPDFDFASARRTLQLRYIFSRLNGIHEREQQMAQQMAQESQNLAQESQNLAQERQDLIRMLQNLHVSPPAMPQAPAMFQAPEMSSASAQFPALTIRAGQNNQPQDHDGNGQGEITMASGARNNTNETQDTVMTDVNENDSPANEAAQNDGDDEAAPVDTSVGGSKDPWDFDDPWGIYK